MPDLRALIRGVSLALPLLAAGCGDDELLSPAGVCSSSAAPAASPIGHGRQVLDQALAQAGITAEVRVVTADDPCAQTILALSGASVAEAPESFVALPYQGGTAIVGRDAVGAMYGELELAERVLGGDLLPPASPITGTPDMAIRAGNLFLTLPLAPESFDTWWFYDPSFWNEYLDLLVRARMNILDLHGMYDIESTLCPNALLYFANSASFPEVGAPKAVRDKNVAMLRTVVAMAAERGIKVGFMTYKTDLALDAMLGHEPPLGDAQVSTYTREAAADLARNVPDLWRLGFRVWESTHPPDWYVGSFVAGLHDSGTGIGIYSRTWGTSKAGMIDIANAAGSPILIEVKYNGDHIGPPYVITGGNVSSTGWWNYSYADYLDPPDPYIFVSEIWSLATHRIFRHASFDRIRRTVAGSKLGASRGISLGAAHAFMPVPDTYHAPGDRFSPWAFRRDEMQYVMFGRLAYDPATPETTFRRWLANRTGTDALWAPVQAAGEIVPWIQTMHSCGPDQRHFAPDMEWGGPVASWALTSLAKYTGPGLGCDSGFQGPIDILSYAMPIDVANDLAAGRPTTRLSPLEAARIVLHDAALARMAGSVPIDAQNAEARDVARECVALADLGDYFGHKLRAATALAIYGKSMSPDYLDAARSETALADAAWSQLATDTAYMAPILETMRMKMLGTPLYHWSLEVPLLAADPASINAFAAQVKPPATPWTPPPASSFLYDAPAPGPGLASLVALPPAGGTQTVVAQLAAEPPPGTVVNVIWKEFSGFADWHVMPAVRVGDVYQAELPKSDASGFFAVEVQAPGAGWRYPDVRTGAPYITVSPSYD